MDKSLAKSDPKVMMGKPVIAGTRIPVKPIIDKLAAGETSKQIIEEHPRLTEEEIRAALAYAARVRFDIINPASELEA